MLTVVAGVLAVMCLGGGVTGYLLYDRITTPDRSSPTVVVDSYLRAFLVDHNDVRADLFTCDGDTDLDQLRLLRSDLAAREERFGTSMSISWGNVLAEEAGNRAEVRVELLLSARVDGVRQYDRQSWTFTTQLAEEWRVCSGVMDG